MYFPLLAALMSLMLLLFCKPVSSLCLSCCFFLQITVLQQLQCELNTEWQNIGSTSDTNVANGSERRRRRHRDSSKKGFRDSPRLLIDLIKHVTEQTQTVQRQWGRKTQGQASVCAVTDQRCSEVCEKTTEVLNCLWVNTQMRWRIKKN